MSGSRDIILAAKQASEAFHGQHRSRGDGEEVRRVLGGARVTRPGGCCTVVLQVMFSYTGSPFVMTIVDLVFPVAGANIAREHGYSLYAALSRLIPGLHSSEGIGIFPIRGTPAGEALLDLGPQSTLRIRVPADRLPVLLPLAGKAIEVDRHHLRIGVPRVTALVPATTLISRLVLIKVAHARERGVTPELFLDAARKQLIALGIAGEAAIPLVRGGPHAGEPRRRVLRVKEQTHAGYAMVVEGLTAEESVRLQEAGLGGRRLMGCGLFEAVREG